MCATLDLQSRVETELRHRHMVSTGSQGQLVAQPLSSEHRALSKTLRTLPASSACLTRKPSRANRKSIPTK
jgi:hypothetical protein